MMLDELEKEGFTVVDETEIQDLTDVKEEKQLVPPAKNVLFEIRKASAGENDSKTWKWVALDLKIVTGIDAEGAYAGKHMFQNICYYADPTSYTSSYFQKQQHLVQLKALASALGLPLKGLKINDTVLADMVGKQVVADIVQTADTVKNADTGKREKTGDMSNEVRNFKTPDVTAGV